MTPRQWMLAAVGRLQERGDHDLARQLADAERCVAELEQAAQGVEWRGVPQLSRALSNMKRVKG